jgi:hypothetical protein
MIDQPEDELLEVLHAVCLLRGGGGVSRDGRAAENLGCHAAAFGAQGFEQIERLDLASAGSLFGDGHDLSNARGEKNALPNAFVAGAEGAPDFGVRLARVDVLRIEGQENSGIMLRQQSFEQVLGADVVVVVVPALLLRGAEYAARGWTKSRKHDLLAYGI